MIKVRIKKSMIQEELLVEDIQNLGLPPIIVTSVLEEFAEPAVQPPPGEPEPPRLEKFAVNKSQDIVGRLYKERARFNLRRLPNLMDKLQDTIQASSEDIGGVPNEFADKFNKIEKFNITDKIPKDGRVAVITYKEMKGLQKSLVKVAKSNLEGDLQEDALEIIESEFSQYYLRIYGVLFGNMGGMSILNYLKKHPSHWKELAKLDYSDAVDYINEVNLTQEKEDDIVHRYKDGYYWYNLGEGGCELEATRMGHCGKDDRGNLVSLRTRPKGSKASKSHVTLSYNEYDDTLYQIKGQGNNSPDSRYWPYIKDFIDRFNISEVKEDGEHSNDDFSPLIEFIQQNTNADVDTRGRELQEYVDHVYNGYEDTDYINFNVDYDDYGDGGYANLSADIDFDVIIDGIPAAAVDGVDGEQEIITVLEGDDFREQISEISYMEDFIATDYGEIALDTMASIQYHGKMVSFLIKVTFTALDEDYRTFSEKQYMVDGVQHYKHNFGEDDIEGYRSDIKDIAMEFMKPYLNTEGKGKIADVLKDIERIEADYKYFYAEYDLADLTQPIDFILSSKLPIQLEGFSFEVPREITHTSVKRRYEGAISTHLNNYNEAIKKIFNEATIRKILNDSIKKVNIEAYDTALRQTRLDFPGYDLGEEDKQQYRYMGGDLFEEVEIRFPSPIDLAQKKTSELPRLGMKARATIKWLDNVDDIDFMMRWVATIDGLWPQILEDMKPKLEDLNIKLRQQRKKYIDTMKKGIRLYADAYGYELRESKRKIKVLLKK